MKYWILHNHGDRINEEHRRTYIIALPDGEEPKGEYFNVSGPHDTEALASAEFWTDRHCKVCNERVWAQYRDEMRDELIERSLCFDCWFWTVCHPPGAPDSIVVMREDGPHHYHAGENVEKLGWCRIGIGHGGTLHRIEFTDGRVVECNNVWHQGLIPARFLHLHVPNATISYPNAAKSQVILDGLLGKKT